MSIKHLDHSRPDGELRRTRRRRNNKIKNKRKEELMEQIKRVKIERRIMSEREWGRGKLKRKRGERDEVLNVHFFSLLFFPRY